MVGTMKVSKSTDYNAGGTIEKRAGIVLNLLFILCFFYVVDNVRIGSRKGNTADQRLRSEAGHRARSGSVLLRKGVTKRSRG